MSEVAWWQGSHGNQYTERNATADIEARIELWGEITDHLPDWPRSILEVGAGSGNNLVALRKIQQNIVAWDYYRCDFTGAEPNEKARAKLEEAGFEARDGTAAVPGRKADLVFTSGVLIHIPPDELLAACQGIYDAAEQYIVCIEYFSADPEEKEYRGRKLWKRDFGSFWLDNFDLTPLGCGFAWKRMTGLDNLTYWIFEK